MGDNWATQGESYSIVPDWKPGQTVTMAQVACCPQCGSLAIRHIGVHDPGGSVVRYRCSACGDGFKMTHKKQSRALVIK